MDLSVIPPPPRLHRTCNTSSVCRAEGCSNNTYNVCGHCVECLPEDGRCHPGSHWSPEEKAAYYAKLRAHANWRFVLMISRLKSQLSRLAIRAAERAYAPGGIGYETAAKDWEDMCRDSE